MSSMRCSTKFEAHAIDAAIGAVSAVVADWAVTPAIPQ